MRGHKDKFQNGAPEHAFIQRRRGGSHNFRRVQRSFARLAEFCRHPVGKGEDTRLLQKGDEGGQYPPRQGYAGKRGEAARLQPRRAYGVRGVEGLYTEEVQHHPGGRDFRHDRLRRTYHQPGSGEDDRLLQKPYRTGQRARHQARARGGRHGRRQRRAHKGIRRLFNTLFTLLQSASRR